jgi:hypothetical protein
MRLASPSHLVLASGGWRRDWRGLEFNYQLGALQGVLGWGHAAWQLALA